MSIGCPVCLAVAERYETEPEALDDLVRYQAVMLTRARAKMDTHKLAAANARVRELQETVQRMNYTRPQEAAVEVAAALSKMDPRDDDLSCFFCFQRIGRRLDPSHGHTEDCIWRRSERIAAVQAKQVMKRRMKSA